MAAKPLTAAQLKPVVDALKANGGNIAGAAEALQMPRGTVENRARTADRLGLLDLDALREAAQKAEPTPKKIEPSPRLPITADEAWEAIAGWIGRKRTPKPKAPKWKPGDVQRVVVAGDFHAPFQDNEVVASLIAEEGPRTDTLIISGDLIDHYSISRFLRYEHVPIEQEIAGADALLGQLSAAFPDVLVVEGNHDKPRFEKQLRAMLSPEMMHCIELLTGGNLSIVHLLAKRYRQYDDHKPNSLSDSSVRAN